MSEQLAEPTETIPPQPAPLNCLLAALDAPVPQNVSDPLLTTEEISYAAASRYTRTPDLIAFAAMRHLGTPVNPRHVGLAREHDLDTPLIRSDGIRLPETVLPAHRKLARVVMPFFSAYRYARNSTDQFRTEYLRPNGSLITAKMVEDLYEGPMELAEHPLLDTFQQARKVLGDRAFEPERVLRYIMLTRLQQKK